jgi:hypothetical protein
MVTVTSVVSTVVTSDNAVQQQCDVEHLNTNSIGCIAYYTTITADALQVLNAHATASAVTLCFSHSALHTAVHRTITLAYNYQTCE